jgi:hypothetical protein
MNLDDKWDWNDKKLPCKVRIESGNPAADDLRDRLREMGMRLALENLKNDEITTTASKKSDALRKKTIRLDSDDAIATTLSSSNYVSGACVFPVRLPCPPSRRPPRPFTRSERSRSLQARR